MGGNGSAYDNAVVESFFATMLNRERLGDERFLTRVRCLDKGESPSGSKSSTTGGGPRPPWTRTYPQLVNSERSKEVLG